MSTITPTTQLRLINNLANLGTASSADLLLIQRNLKSFKFQYSDLVTGLPDDNTIEASSDKLRIKDLGVTTGKIANNAVNFSKMQDIANNKLVGRTASGSGDPSEIDIITDLGGASNTNIPTGLAVVNYINNTTNSLAILEESQPNGVFCDGTSSQNTSWESTYDPNNYTATINHRKLATTTFKFFQRNINTITVNQNNIVSSLTSKKFTLEEGTYFIKAYGWADDQNYSQIRLKRHNINTSYGLAYVNYIVQYNVNDIRNLAYFESVIDVSGTPDERTYSFEQGSNEYNVNSDYGSPYQLNGLDEVYFRAEILKIS